MALVVGTDSYVTQAEATTYVAGHFIAGSAELVAWTALSSDSKDAVLRRAQQIIDRQILVGIRAVQGQTLEFPRAIPTQFFTNLPVGYQFLDTDLMVQTVVPTEVKNAQAEEAVSQAIGVPQRLKLRREGVKSFRLGNLSEDYGGAPLQFNSLVAYEMLKPFLSGSVVIV